MDDDEEDNNTTDSESDDQGVPVADDEQTLRRTEQRYAATRARIRQRQESIRRMQEELAREEEALARDEEEEQVVRREYIASLSNNQAQSVVFERAVRSGSVDEYLSAVNNARRRTTMPRTWRDWNDYTTNI